VSPKKCRGPDEVFEEMKVGPIADLGRPKADMHAAPQMMRAQAASKRKVLKALKGLHFWLRCDNAWLSPFCLIKSTKSALV
jgi:hypothetical protein